MYSGACVLQAPPLYLPPQSASLASSKFCYSARSPPPVSRPGTPSRESSITVLSADRNQACGLPPSTLSSRSRFPCFPCSAFCSRWRGKLYLGLIEGQFSYYWGKAESFAGFPSHPSLWIVNGEDGAVLSLFYVDDGLVAARTPKEADALVDLMESIFAIRKLGEPVDFLGIEIRRDRGARTITITQKAKAEELAAMHRSQEAGKAEPRVPMSTPLIPRIVGSAFDCANPLLASFPWSLSFQARDACLNP
jgi:hypothetical protein